MKSYFIESLKISKLWGYRDIDISFNSDVNILIGPNGSGKTTVLNLLHSILSANLPSLSKTKFDQAVIKLRSFKGRSVRTVKVEVEDRLLRLGVGQTKFDIDLDSIGGRRFPDVDAVSSRRLPQSYTTGGKGSYAFGTVLRPYARWKIVQEALYDRLASLVPIVWLPVNRRLPVTEDEKERSTMAGPLESVDLRLRELLTDLARYQTRLNALLSERYRKFEHQVLSVMLYSREHDELRSIRDSMLHSIPTEDEQKQLLGAFQAAGLLDEQMQIRIDDHFAAAEVVLKRVKEEAGWDLEDILVLPLIGRTKAMVEFAGELEKDRERIFQPLRRYEEVVNSFLTEKSVKVDEDGEFKIESGSSPNLDPFVLSSGEKQILILLTQALLKSDDPVVYIADEPELSLHVTWQEKLLESLVSLSGLMQVIVATHSPDIVGGFMDKIIDLGRKN